MNASCNSVNELHNQQTSRFENENHSFDHHLNSADFQHNPNFETQQYSVTNQRDSAPYQEQSNNFYMKPTDFESSSAMPQTEENTNLRALEFLLQQYSSETPHHNNHNHVILQPQTLPSVMDTPIVVGYCQNRDQLDLPTPLQLGNNERNKEERVDIPTAANMLILKPLTPQDLYEKPIQQAQFPQLIQQSVYPPSSPYYPTSSYGTITHNAHLPPISQSLFPSQNFYTNLDTTHSTRTIQGHPQYKPSSSYTYPSSKQQVDNSSHGSDASNSPAEYGTQQLKKRGRPKRNFKVEFSEHAYSLIYNGKGDEFKEQERMCAKRGGRKRKTPILQTVSGEHVVEGEVKKRKDPPMTSTEKRPRRRKKKANDSKQPSETNLEQDEKKKKTKENNNKLSGD